MKGTVAKWRWWWFRLDGNNVPLLQFSTFQIFHFHSFMLFCMFQFFLMNMLYFLPCLTVCMCVFLNSLSKYNSHGEHCTQSQRPAQWLSQTHHASNIQTQNRTGTPETEQNRHPRSPPRARFQSLLPQRATIILTFNSLLYFKTQFYMNKLIFLYVYN